MSLLPSRRTFALLAAALATMIAAADLGVADDKTLVIPPDCAAAEPAAPFASPADLKRAKTVNWAIALPACQKAAEAAPNDPHVQFLLGLAYDKSNGLVQAVRYYTLAANANYAPAEVSLGYLFVMGRGVVKDYQRAYELFHNAATAGDPNAMGNLGSMFASGFFVKKDDAQALAWYEKSIEAGNSFGLAQAGVMYYNGAGTPRDYDAAAQYFQQAADMNDGFSLKFLAIMSERGLLGKPDPEKAAELRRKAAEVDPDSQDPVVPAPQKTAPVHRASSVHYVTIRRYRFFGCSWIWC